MLEETRVYFDHNATTPVDAALYPIVDEVVKNWGNPSSIYSLSRSPKKILRESRQSFAEKLKAHPLEIIFTSGGSESNNMALKGLMDHFKKNAKDTLVVSSVEHPAILKTAKYLATKGLNVFYLPVSKEGAIDDEFLKDHLKKHKVGLVSVMAANNETGVIHPITQLCEMAHSYQSLFHTDAVQLVGKTQLNFAEMNVDLASFSAHKFYSLKGAGVLYCRKGIALESLIHGGGQERSRRAGTENILAIACMKFMIERLDQLEAKLAHVEGLRDYFELEIQKAIPGIEVTAKSQKRLVNTSHLVVKDTDGENLLMNLDLAGFEVSTGAACSAGSPEPSAALLAMGYHRSEAQSSLRVSFGKNNTMPEVQRFIETLKQVIPHLRAIKNQI
jgi:cysteine desulfurase